MSLDVEPPMKRPKLDNISNILTETIDENIERINRCENNLQAVISDDIHQPLQLIKVFVGHIKSPKDISRTILILNEKTPLKELSHLKRVRRQDIILCPTNALNETSSIQEYIERHASELKDVFDYFKEVEVPMLPPRITKQYNEARRLWSCNFHPNDYLEKLVSDNFFNTYELMIHKKYMRLAFEIVKWYTTQSVFSFDGNDMFRDINACVVVDPILDRVIALAFDNRQSHPMQHSSMLAIDNVAKTQNGGVWSTSDLNSSAVPGIDKELLQYLKEKFSHLKIGLTKSKNESQGEKDGPYLCTGYYIYIMKEPCIMCSMALVHARAKRIFYTLSNNLHGGLNSKVKLQTVSSLNHHFEVFTGFL